MVLIYRRRPCSSRRATLLSLSLSLSFSLSFYIFRLILSTQLTPVWKIDQPVGWRLLHPRATRSIRDSPLLLSCSPPISFTYTRGSARARAHQLSRFPLPLLSSFHARPYRQSSVVSNGNSKSEQHHRQQHQKRSTVRFEAVFLLLCWLPLSSLLFSLLSHLLPSSVELFSCAVILQDRDPTSPRSLRYTFTPCQMII